MHQELSKRTKVSPIRLSGFVLIIATFLILLNTLLYDYHMNSSISDFFILVIVIAGSYVFIKQNRISYKYSLIENDFFIHEIIGSKEKNIVSINMDQVVAFESVSAACYRSDQKQEYAKKRKLYNCTNNGNRHYLVYMEEGKQQWITFHPSTEMCTLLNKRLKKVTP